MKTILIYVESQLRVAFFMRFVDGLRAVGYEAVFITSRLSFYVKLSRVSRAYLLRAAPQEDGRVCPLTAQAAEQNIDVIVGAQTPNQARAIATATYLRIAELIAREHPLQIWLWNGLSATGLAITEAANRSGVSIRYFELANLPGKLFVDPEGVNALCSIARDQALLDKLPPVDNTEIQKWLIYYEAFKKAPPPQAVLIKKLDYWAYPVDVLAWHLGIGLQDDFRSIRHNVQRKLAARRRRQVGILGNLDDKYVFLPLQVSNDTNVTIHSDVDNVQALEAAGAVARAEGARLYAKVHPAEPDGRFIERIIDVCNGNGCVIVNNSTLELLKKAHRVVSINSTVGLEAILLGKKVDFLGRSQYKDMSFSRAWTYVMRYLVDIDPFSDDACGPDNVRRVVAGA